MIKRQMRVAILLGLSLCSTELLAFKDVAIKKETPKMAIDIVYPQQSGMAAVDEQVQLWILAQQKTFMKDIVAGNDAPADAPGKNGLNITYTVPYNKPPALSYEFMVSTFSQGAAHPFNATTTMSFINGKQVSLNQLFKTDAPYLQKLAAISKAAIKAKKITDADWLAKGTAPKAENYNEWYFSKDGLVVVLDTYQVAAYVYGPQDVTIPKADLIPMMKPEMIKAIWGHA